MAAEATPRRVVHALPSFPYFGVFRISLFILMLNHSSVQFVSCYFAKQAKPAYHTVEFLAILLVCIKNSFIRVTFWRSFVIFDT